MKKNIPIKIRSEIKTPYNNFAISIIFRELNFHINLLDHYLKYLFLAGAYRNDLLVNNFEHDAEKIADYSDFEIYLRLNTILSSSASIRRLLDVSKNKDRDRKKNAKVRTENLQKKLGLGNLIRQIDSFKNQSVRNDSEHFDENVLDEYLKNKDNFTRDESDKSSLIGFGTTFLVSTGEKSTLFYPRIFDCKNFTFKVGSKIIDLKRLQDDVNLLRERVAKQEYKLSNGLIVSVY